MKESLISLPGGFEVEAFGDTALIVEEIWNKDCYHPLKSLNQHDVVIDVGANQGIFALYAASMGAKVYAVEPDAMNYSLLCRNIERNGLQGKIIPHHFALGSENGEIELFIPERDGETVTGLITTSTEVQGKYSGLDLTRLRVDTVQCRKMSDFIEEVPETNIRFLKIDCEGAELDILRGVENGNLTHVEQLVMETHWGYSEKALYQRVRDLGFRVTHYEKIRGVYSTGYLFANSATAENIDEYEKPVAHIRVQQKSPLGVAIAASADESFSSEDVHKSLQYHWSLDGKVLDGEHSKALLVEADELGCHELSLRVRDGELEDTEQAYFWHMTPDYAQIKDPKTIHKRSDIQQEWVEDEQAFVFKKDQIPQGWESNYLYIDVVERDREGKNTDASYIRFNGIDYPFVDGYARVELKHFPEGCDLHFSVVAAEKARYSINCYAMESPLHEAEATCWFDGSGPFSLDHYSQDYACEIKNSEKFLLNLSRFTDWSPAVLKIGIKAAEGYAEQGELTGVARFAGKETALSGWYTEIAYSNEEYPDELTLELHVDQPRGYELVWWPE
jgi:FkbM family methyltransferase